MNRLIKGNFIEDIKQILKKSRNKAYSVVNAAMIEAYWQIGKRIVLEEQAGEKRADYGAELIKTLSKELSSEFGKGFSIANLKNFRQFYLTFPDFEKSYTLSSELTWSHYRLIMRVGSKEAREYYLKESLEESWSTRQLERNINSFYFERLLTQPENAVASKNIKQINKSEFIKDPFVLEFLNLPEDVSHTEKTIESGIISHLQKFLLEMGKGFSFIGRQFRISSESSHFYIDLVFYNYLLKCFVLIDLKTTKLTHQDIGQLDMYVRMFDDLKRQADDNPTIGIILCTDKDETVVKYSVLKDSEQLFASKYRLILPTEEELKNEVERKIHLLEYSEEE